MRQIGGNKNEERLAVVLSGDFGTKILGIPSLGSQLKGKYGRTASLAIMKLLEEWGCKESVVAICFDTTAANTGKDNGTCVILKSMLQRPINMLACRRHIGETLLRNVWKASNIEPSKAPKSQLFGKFQTHWDDVKNFESDELHLPLLGSAEFLVDYLKMAQQCKSIRDDYKEVVTVVHYW